MKTHLQLWWLSFSDIFNWKNDEARGRTVILWASVLAALYSVFISGIFYTGFLSMYGISITGTGILSFIPYAANILCIFSSKILGRFHKRKTLLLTAKLIYYFFYIVVTTIMPNFVTDPNARLICFIIIMIGASAFYSPFSPGFTTWFYNFYPEDNEKRSKFFLYMQIISTALSSLLMIFSSILTDALSNSPYQDTLILAFRYFAFIFVLVEIFIQSKAKEYPYVETEETKLVDIFTRPLKYKKFFYCVLLMFAWNYICMLSYNMWDYHLLNHLDYSYTLVNAMNVIYPIMVFAFSAVWQNLLRRYSWIKTFGIAILSWAPTEFIFFFLTKDSEMVFVVLRMIQNVAQLGLNLASANVLYMNLPEEDTTTHIAFYTVGTNILSLLSIVTSTFISSITGDQAVRMLGMNVYSVQFVPVFKACVMGIVGLLMVLKWRSFTPKQHIEELEHFHNVRKKRSREQHI